MSTNDRGEQVIELKVPFEGEPAKDLRVIAYVFDSAGNFVTGAPLEGEYVKLALDARRLHRPRIFLGPPPPEGREKQQPTLELMQKLNAYEPVLRLDPASQVLELAPIPELHWRDWLWCRCRIRGQVVKPISLGGTISELPVCHARVHICEVDRLPWYILRLPDHLVFRLRDELLRELVRPIPDPIPDPPFQIDPGFIDPSPENIARRFERAALNPQPLPPRAARIQRAASMRGMVELNPQPEPPGLARASALAALNPQPEPPGLTSLPAATRAALLSSSPNVVRDALTLNLDLIRPYLCRWPWFWWRYRCDEIAVLETDAQGRFDTTYWYRCFGDHPDLYFWVEYNIGGVWTTVYHPPLPCNVYWNYACGTEVTIRVTDPRVPVCGNPPDPSGRQVVVMGIGEEVSVHEIQGAAAAANEGLTTFGEPFGGVLEPRVLFGREALFAADITYYRWSYHRMTLSDGVAPAADPDWHHLSQPVVRHYMLIDPNPPFAVSFPVEPMGPVPEFPGQNLFKIQPFQPSVPSDGWVVVDSHQDNATAFFETHLLDTNNPDLAAGKYELKLELFRSDGTLVNLTAAGVMVRIPDVPAPFGAGTVTTVSAPAEHLIVDPATGDVLAFRMVVRVDNNVCHGDIYDVEVNGDAAGPCGFLEYTEGTAGSTNAHISFLAMHPHDFATFDFTVVRGSAGNVDPACASGDVGVPQGSFTHAGGVYSQDVSVAALLNNPSSVPPCTRGAFAERLHVYATATNGWSRLSYLDAPRAGESGLKAFAIASVPPEPPV